MATGKFSHRSGSGLVDNCLGFNSTSNQRHGGNNNGVSKTTTSASTRLFEQHAIEVPPTRNGIFISNLPKSYVDGEELKRVFEDYGTITTSYIAIDKRAGKSLGYAKVFYEHARSAIKAVEEVDKLIINGQVVKVEYFIPKEDRDREPPFTNLYVKNFAGAFHRPEDLLLMFRKVGPIASYRIEKDSKGKLMGVGYIRYELFKDAKTAVSQFNGLYLVNTGKQLHVSKYESKAGRAGNGASSSTLPSSTLPSEIKRMSPIAGYMVGRSDSDLKNETDTMSWPSSESSFSATSSTDLNIVKSSGNQKNMINNWINKTQGIKICRAKTPFEGTDDTESEHSISDEDEDNCRSTDANYSTDEHEQDARKENMLSPSSTNYSKKPENKSINNLYVKNFKGAIRSHSELRGIFKIFGAIISAKIIGPGYGFVAFRNPSDAKNAKETLNGVKISNGRRLFVDAAKSKDEREKEFETNLENACAQYWQVRNRRRDGGRRSRRRRQRRRSEPMMKKSFSDNYAQTVEESSAGSENDEIHCQVCSKHGNSDEFMMLDCQHVSCKKCLTDWLTICIGCGDIEAIHCPNKNCMNTFDPDLLKALVGNKMFKKYDKLVLDKYLESLIDIVFCPKCTTPMEIDLDCPTIFTRCRIGKCGYFFKP